MANTFPVVDRTPGKAGFSVTPDAASTSIASSASGLPVVNELFTFTPLIFKHSRFLVSTANKDTIMTFYEANKGLPFDWLNTQDGNTYEVIFMKPPQVSMGGVNDRWTMKFEFKQYSPL